jgi:hypothetical protein
MEVFRGVSTPFHIGTWHFPCDFFWGYYISSLCFIVVTTLVLELRALRFSTIEHRHVTVFFFFFYTVSQRNLNLSMRFFWVKLHIEFAFRHLDQFCSGVTCPACVRPKWSFPGVFSTPFHIGTWNFQCDFSDVTYISSLCFVLVTTLVLELSSSWFSAIGRMHGTVFLFFLHHLILEPETFNVVFLR